LNGNMQSEKPDVIEAPGRIIQVPTSDRRVRYGTVGTGLDLGRLVWPKDYHIFSSQAVSVHEMNSQLPGRPNSTKELGPAGGGTKECTQNPPGGGTIDRWSGEPRMEKMGGSC
jgi:hypothetical protein